jgi:hypothetical protein
MASGLFGDGGLTLTSIDVVDHLLSSAWLSLSQAVVSCRAQHAASEVMK